MSEHFKFTIEKELEGELGRVGTYHTPHGVIETPAFVAVGTKATVKTMTPEMVAGTGAQVALGNTYHLLLRPGEDIVAAAGGLGKFMNWPGPTMTDSGGFQVFSLGEAFGTKVSKVATGEVDVVSERKGYAKNNKLCQIDEQGVTFTSHLDGSKHRLDPEKSMEIQWKLGADMIFAFDECTSPRAPHAYQNEAMQRTHRWAKRCLDKHTNLDPENIQALFAVVQGGQHEDLRRQSAQVLASMQIHTGEQFDGFGIGGSFTKDDLGTAVKWVNSELPRDKPRHLLGIGEPRDLIEGVRHGCDFFDCVAPTRMGRHGGLYTKDGVLHILNTRYKKDFSPVEDTCGCYTCQNYTRAYLSHLFRAKEGLGATLASIHNLYFIVHLVADLRQSIIDDTFSVYTDTFLGRYYKT
ncbi:MAG: queuine tRNA-ribosyltransferase [Planctomycetota bacterium]|jgi:queuine tRNA-ribosyltransferase